MLHSSAQEVVLRRLEGPELSEQDEARIDAWVARLMGEDRAQVAGGAAAASSASASAGASAVAAPAAAAGTTAPNYVSSVAPRISPWSLLGHLLWANTLGGASAASTAPSRSKPIVTLGQLTELWAEMQQLALRIEALQAREEAAASAAAAAQGGKARAASGISSVTGSTTTLQRLQVRQREVVNRLKQLQQSLASYPAAASSSASASAAAASDSVDDPLADAELHSVCDFPSAALVARGLQVLGVLPRARTRPQQPQQQGASSEALVLSMAPPGDDGAAASLPTVSIPGARVPPISAYAPRHFLSASHVPLLHMRSLRSAAPGASSDTAVAAGSGAGAGADTAAASSRLRALPDVFFHREMFLKTKHKSLPFTVEE